MKDNKESSPEEQKRTCTLSDEELWIRCDRWVSKLAESGGRGWVLRVPPDYDNDPDMLFLELLQRFAATFVKAKLTPSEPVETAEEILERVMAKESKGDSVAYYIEQGAIIEAMKEYASQFKEGVKGVRPHDPNDSWQNEGDENVYTETGHPGF